MSRWGEVIHFTVLWSKKCEKREYEKKENENENEEYYILLLVLFDENFALALKLFCAAAGVERSGVDDGTDHDDDDDDDES